MVDGDLDENDWHPVGVLDPHLDQSPGLGPGLLAHTDASGGQPLMLSVDIADLDPDHHRPSGGAGTVAGNLQEPRAEEEHQSRIGRGAELSVDRQAQHVAVETPALIQVGGPPFHIHILPQRLEKLTLVGTTVIFFTIVNWMKIIPYFALGQFSPRNMATSALLLPLAVATNFLGVWLVRITPTDRFYRIAYILMLLIAIALLWQGARGFVSSA